MVVNRKPTQGKLLLVEDDEQIAEPLVFGLETAGFEVFHTGDSEEGLSLAVSLEPSLVLLDVMLPGMDGFEICQKLRVGFFILIGHLNLRLFIRIAF